MAIGWHEQEAETQNDLTRAVRLLRRAAPLVEPDLRSKIRDFLREMDEEETAA